MLNCLCRLMIVGTLLLEASGCRSGGNTAKPLAKAVNSAETSNTEAALKVEHFGAALGGAPRHPVTAVLADPSAFTAHPIQIDGHVRRACSRKGCWMELAAGSDAALPGCRVTFRDYGFFVPTDSQGARALAEGELKLRRLTPQRVAHYEAEGATFAAKHPDGSADEVQFIASGVELRR
jgi:hypothetical protein